MNALVKEIIGQALGVISAILTFLSYQVNTKRLLLILQTAATACTCASFFFLGASSGFALNAVCLVRNVIFFFQKEGTPLQYVSASILATVMLILGFFSWQGPISLLIILPLVANTVILSFGNPQLLRKSILFTSSSVLLYNVFVFSIGGIGNEAIAIISSIIGIIRFRREKHAAQ